MPSSADSRRCGNPEWCSTPDTITGDLVTDVGIEVAPKPTHDDATTLIAGGIADIHNARHRVWWDYLKHEATGPGRGGSRDRDGARYGKFVDGRDDSDIGRSSETWEDGGKGRGTSITSRVSTR